MDKIRTLYYLFGLWLTRPLLRSKRGLAFLRWWRMRGFRQNLLASDYYKSLANASLSTFPIVDKATSLANFNEINTVRLDFRECLAVAQHAEVTRDFSPTIGDIAVGLSSGTSGNKGIFLTSPSERARWVACILDRILGFSLRHRKVAFFLRANNELYETVDSKLISFIFFDLSRPITELTAELVDLNPDILVAQPSVLLELSRSINPWSLHARIISVAEVLESDVQKRLEKYCKVRVEQIYQATEGFLAHTCRHGQLHLNEDWLIIEKRKVGPNRFHPILTDLWRRSQPLVRYELNDILHISTDACSCGLASTVIKHVEGRADDIFRFAGPAGEVILFPDFIRRAVLNASDDLDNFEVARTGLQSVSLFVSTPKNALPTSVSSSDEGDEQSIQQQAYVAAEQGLRALFEKHQLHITINRRETPSQGPAAKFKRIRNDYQPSY